MKIQIPEAELSQIEIAFGSHEQNPKSPTEDFDESVNNGPTFSKIKTMTPKSTIHKVKKESVTQDQDDLITDRLN